MLARTGLSSMWRIAGEEVSFCLNQAGFVAVFPEAAGTVIAAVDVLHITLTNCLHEFGYVIYSG